MSSEPMQLDNTAPQSLFLSPPTPLNTDGTALTSDQLPPNQLAHLKQTASPTPAIFSLLANIRSETIIHFYDKLVDMNTSIAMLARGLDSELLATCILEGVAPFWNGFVPLPAHNLVLLAKQMEARALEVLVSAAQGQTRDVGKLVDEYLRAAAKYGPSGSMKGMERFAWMAQRVRDGVDTDEDPMDICEQAFSRLNVG
jgi:hypothetical protein